MLCHFACSKKCLVVEGDRSSSSREYGNSASDENPDINPNSDDEKPNVRNFKSGEPNDAVTSPQLMLPLKFHTPTAFLSDALFALFARSLTHPPVQLSKEQNFRSSQNSQQSRTATSKGSNNTTRKKGYESIHSRQQLLQQKQQRPWKSVTSTDP